MFLPPKLPGGDDTDTKEELCVIDFVLDSLRLFIDKVDSQYYGVVITAAKMMENMRMGRESNGYLQEKAVREVLQTLASASMVPARWNHMLKR